MSHIDFLKIAVEESLLSVQAGSSPFGAVIVKDGKIIAKAHNQLTAAAERNVQFLRQLIYFHFCHLYTSVITPDYFCYGSLIPRKRNTTSVQLHTGGLNWWSKARETNVSKGRK